MKYLFVGDVHNHFYMFSDVERLDREHNFDRIIFLGDYVDDWCTSNRESLITLDMVFKWKRNFSEKYTFLIGNHELSYLGYKCAGHDYDLENAMEMKLRENLDKLSLYTTVKCGDVEYVCTHAGINNSYIKNMLDGKDKWKDTLKEMNEHKRACLYMLNVVSYTRGGNDPFSSFVWSDATEHILDNKHEEPIIPNQIIGHTPVKTIVDENGFIFIDTHSTYRSGEPFGDKSYLMWDEDIFKVVY